MKTNVQSQGNSTIEMTQLQNRSLDIVGNDIILEATQYDIYCWAEDDAVNGVGFQSHNYMTQDASGWYRSNRLSNFGQNHCHRNQDLWRGNSCWYCFRVSMLLQEYVGRAVSSARPWEKDWLLKRLKLIIPWNLQRTSACNFLVQVSMLAFSAQSFVFSVAFNAFQWPKATNPAGGTTLGVWVQDLTPPIMLLVRAEAIAAATLQAELLPTDFQNLQVEVQQNFIFLKSLFASTYALLDFSVSSTFESGHTAAFRAWHRVVWDA